MTYARQPSQAERIELQRMTRQAVGRVSQRAQQWVIAKAVSEAGPEVAILYGEESRVQLLPLIRAMWHWVGQQLRIPTPSTNVTRALFGALNIRTERWVYLVRKRMRTDDFLAFLEHLLVVYPDGPILLIVDNFSSHTAQAVSTWLATHARLHLYYSPKYCSHVNPVERIWLQLKNRLTANRLYGSLPLLLTIVEAVFTLTALGLILPGEWRRPTSLLQDEDLHGRQAPGRVWLEGRWLERERLCRRPATRKRLETVPAWKERKSPLWSAKTIMASSGGLLKAIFMRFSATSVEPGRRQRKSYRKPSTRSANRVEASGMR